MLLNLDVILTHLHDQLLCREVLLSFEMLYNIIHHKQAQVYEDLSAFINVFKRALATTQHLFVSLEKKCDISLLLLTMREIVGEIRQLGGKYEEDECSEIIERITFNRFVYRLLEIIANKSKYLIMAGITLNPSYLAFIKDIQAFLASIQTKSFHQLANFMQRLLLKCINSMLFTSDGALRLQHENENVKKMGKLFSEDYHQFKLSQPHPNSNSLFIKNEKNQQSQFQNCLIQKKGKNIIGTQTFLDIQKNFERYRGMDLDFSYFRGSFFEAKNNYDTFYKEYLERNGSLLRITSKFGIQFQGYSRRQAKINSKRDRGQENNVQNGDRTVDERAYQDMGRQDNGGRGQEPYISKQNSMVIPPSLESPQVSDKIKKVYASLGNKQQNCKISSTLMKKRIIINHNKSFLYAFPNKNRSQIRNKANQSGCRLRTEGASERSKDNSCFSESKDEKREESRYMGGLRSPKAEIRTKYFQLSCVTTPAKEQPSKFRGLISNKFSIKHADKTKLSHWFTKK